jgi:DNA helicase-2/ATP-dependent DNA helicase PcrA
MDVLNGLNEQQKEAVLATEGPVLILAGAGSGKTRALTHRIAYLMMSKSVRPQNILAVTFTNKAAGVMKERIAKLIGPKDDDPKVFLPWMGTFHSVCVKILRREATSLGISNQFTIYDQDDSLRVVKRSMREENISEKTYNPRAVRAYISQAKGELVDAKGYSVYALEHFTEIVSKVYLRYEGILKSASALDFDDLLFKTVQLFQKHPEVLEKYQNMFRYILIDEYQDTNHAQYILIKLLASKYRNIFAIGDDWQSIYSFRGAKFQNILDFKRDYPEAKTILLEENYRSTSAILDAAQNIIKKNEIRSDKNLYTRAGGGAPVVVTGAQSKYDEIDFVLDELQSLQEGEKRSLNDFVILYRTNAQSRSFEESLIRRQLSYRIIGGVRFYERKEIKDVLAYLKLIINPSEPIALSRVVNVPPRGIGGKTLEKILVLGVDEAAKEISKFKEFAKIMEQVRTQAQKITNLPDLISTVMSKTGYHDFLNDGTFEGQGRLENVEELKNAAASYDTLEEFLESVALIADIDAYNEKEESLTLMTVHAAKGLEFPVVFISGMEEGLFPHANSLDDQFQLEEERRLMYVGMTRAMERLYLTFARSRLQYGTLISSSPSRFLEELPQDQIEVIDL